jgi:hypothetical protein
MINVTFLFFFVFSFLLLNKTRSFVVLLLKNNGMFSIGLLCFFKFFSGSKLLAYNR